MEIEYSQEVKGRVHAYRFYDFEKKAIARGLKSEVKKLEVKLQKIIDHPDNEGQATFLCQADEIRGDISNLKEIIEIFSGK
jgi:hypothetical protein